MMLLWRPRLVRIASQTLATRFGGGTRSSDRPSPESGRRRRGRRDCFAERVDRGLRSDHHRELLDQAGLVELEEVDAMSDTAMLVLSHLLSHRSYC